MERKEYLRLYNIDKATDKLIGMCVFFQSSSPILAVVKLVVS